MPQIEPLESLPGVDATAAREILGAMGTDRSRCGARRPAWRRGPRSSPGHNARAGKRRQGRTGTGHRYVRRLVVPWAWTARKTSTLLGRTFRRLAARLGGTRAAVAVGQKMLVSVYPRLWQGTSDEEQRDADQRPTQEERARKRAIKALERLGYHVTVARGASSLGVHSKL